MTIRRFISKISVVGGGHSHEKQTFSNRDKIFSNHYFNFTILI